MLVSVEMKSWLCKDPQSATSTLLPTYPPTLPYPFTFISPSGSPLKIHSTLDLPVPAPLPHISLAYWQTLPPPAIREKAHTTPVRHCTGTGTVPYDATHSSACRFIPLSVCVCLPLSLSLSLPWFCMDSTRLDSTWTGSTWGTLTSDMRCVLCFLCPIHVTT